MFVSEVGNSAGDRMPAGRFWITNSVGASASALVSASTSASVVLLLPIKSLVLLLSDSVSVLSWIASESRLNFGASGRSCSISLEASATRCSKSPVIVCRQPEVATENTRTIKIADLFVRIASPRSVCECFGRGRLENSILDDKP